MASTESLPLPESTYVPDYGLVDKARSYASQSAETYAYTPTPQDFEECRQIADLLNEDNRFIDARGTDLGGLSDIEAQQLRKAGNPSQYRLDPESRAAIQWFLDNKGHNNQDVPPDPDVAKVVGQLRLVLSDKIAAAADTHQTRPQVVGGFLAKLWSVQRLDAHITEKYPVTELPPPASDHEQESQAQGRADSDQEPQASLHDPKRQHYSNGTPGSRRTPPKGFPVVLNPEVISSEPSPSVLGDTDGELDIVRNSNIPGIGDGSAGLDPATRQIETDSSEADPPDFAPAASDPVETGADNHALEATDADDFDGEDFSDIEPDSDREGYGWQDGNDGYEYEVRVDDAVPQRSRRLSRFGSKVLAMANTAARSVFEAASSNKSTTALVLGTVALGVTAKLLKINPEDALSWANDFINNLDVGSTETPLPTFEPTVPPAEIAPATPTLPTPELPVEQPSAPEVSVQPDDQAAEVLQTSLNERGEGVEAAVRELTADKGYSESQIRDIVRDTIANNDTLAGKDLNSLALGTEFTVELPATETAAEQLPGAGVATEVPADSNEPAVLESGNPDANTVEDVAINELAERGFDVPDDGPARHRFALRVADFNGLSYDSLNRLPDGQIVNFPDDREIIQRWLLESLNKDDD